MTDTVCRTTLSQEAGSGHPPEPAVVARIAGTAGDRTSGAHETSQEIPTVAAVAALALMAATRAFGANVTVAVVSGP